MSAPAFTGGARRRCDYNPSMLVPERHRFILRLLGQQGRLALEEIESHCEVSAATARRDADQLAKSGLARRARGALLPLDFALVEPRYSRKAERATSLKVRLAH